MNFKLFLVHLISVAIVTIAGKNGTVTDAIDSLPQSIEDSIPFETFEFNLINDEEFTTRESDTASTNIMASTISSRSTLFSTNTIMGIHDNRETLVENFKSSRFEENFGIMPANLITMRKEDQAFLGKEFADSVNPIALDVTTKFGDNMNKNELRALAEMILFPLNANNEDKDETKLPVETTPKLILSTTEAQLPTDLQTDSTLCEHANETVTFIRHASSISKSIALMRWNTTNEIFFGECAAKCLENRRHCNGFTFSTTLSNSESNECKLYNVRQMHNSSSPSFPSNYFERTCVTAMTRYDCRHHAKSKYESHARKLLPIVPTTVWVVANRRACLDTCLTHSTCRAVNFNPQNGTCEILDRGWRLVIGGLVDFPDFDYYENTCVQVVNRCNTNSGRTISYILTRNTILDEFNISAYRDDDGMNAITLKSLENCRQKCELSEDLFCRSFQYRTTDGECILSTETFYQLTTVTEADPTISSTSPTPPPSSSSAVVSEDMDLYEPVCLNTTFLTDRLNCSGKYLFERVPEMNLVSNFGDPLPGIVIPNAIIELCMEACLRAQSTNDSCISFVYSRVDLKCTLLTVKRHDHAGLTLAILEPLSDYYELACTKNDANESNLKLNSIQDTKDLFWDVKHERRVQLRVLRGGLPVSNVFIGERLTALVYTEYIETSRLSVADCNATRVIDHEPSLQLQNSVQLIRDGCSLMPQIIGDMRRVANGFAAPLIAFRIDGSDQIDIVCSVVVCRVRCSQHEDAKCEKHCLLRDTTNLYRNATLKHLMDDQTSLIMVPTSEDRITVDRRLYVIDDANDNFSNDGNNKGTVDVINILTKTGDDTMHISTSTISELFDTNDSLADNDIEEQHNNNNNNINVKSTTNITDETAKIAENTTNIKCIKSSTPFNNDSQLMSDNAINKSRSNKNASNIEISNKIKIPENIIKSTLPDNDNDLLSDNSISKAHEINKSHENINDNSTNSTLNYKRQKAKTHKNNDNADNNDENNISLNSYQNQGELLENERTINVNLKRNFYNDDNEDQENENNFREYGRNQKYRNGDKSYQSRYVNRQWEGNDLDNYGYGSTQWSSYRRPLFIDPNNEINAIDISRNDNNDNNNIIEDSLRKSAHHYQLAHYPHQHHHHSHHFLKKENSYDNDNEAARNLPRQFRALMHDAIGGAEYCLSAAVVLILLALVLVLSLGLAASFIARCFKRRDEDRSGLRGGIALPTASAIPPSFIYATNTELTGVGGASTVRPHHIPRVERYMI